MVGNAVRVAGQRLHSNFPKLLFLWTINVVGNAVAAVHICVPVPLLVPYSLPSFLGVVSSEHAEHKHNRMRGQSKKERKQTKTNAQAADKWLRDFVDAARHRLSLTRSLLCPFWFSSTQMREMLYLSPDREHLTRAFPDGQRQQRCWGRVSSSGSDGGIISIESTHVAVHNNNNNNNAAGAITTQH